MIRTENHGTPLGPTEGGPCPDCGAALVVGTDPLTGAMYDRCARWCGYRFLVSGQSRAAQERLRARVAAHTSADRRAVEQGAAAYHGDSEQPETGQRHNRAGRRNQWTEAEGDGWLARMLADPTLTYVALSREIGCNEHTAAKYVRRAAERAGVPAPDGAPLFAAKARAPEATPPPPSEAPAPGPVARGQMPLHVSPRDPADALVRAVRASRDPRAA